MKFQIYIDKAGEFRWRLKADNGRIMADSGEGYSTKSNAKRAARNLRRGLRFGRVRYEDLTTVSR